jgi:hypothetical protein
VCGPGNSLKEQGTLSPEKEPHVRIPVYIHQHSQYLDVVRRSRGESVKNGYNAIIHLKFEVPSVVKGKKKKKNRKAIPETGRGGPLGMKHRGSHIF